MNSETTRFDLTSADTKIIGFDFQYFYFINELLKLDIGQSIGFEAKDDVHLELPSNKKVIIQLIQLKHSLQKNANYAPINLTDKDADLWKTMSNWSKVICDISEKRFTKIAQLDYLENTEFILATNKNISNNKFISNVKKYSKGGKTFTEISNYLLDLFNSTKDENIIGYISNTRQSKVFKAMKHDKPRQNQDFFAWI